MELHHLRCFLAVIEEGGFKKATNRLHMTQPALSYQIKQLEQELQVELFNRRPSGVTPTEAGRVLFQHAKKILEDVKRAERSVEELSEGVRGEIRIGTVNSIGIYFLPQVLLRIREQYPHARPNVLYRDSDEIIDALVSNAIDLALVADPRTDRRLKQETIIFERVSLVCGRTHPYYGRETIRPSELERCAFIALSPGSPTGQLIRQHLSRLGVHVETVVSTDNVETVKKMTEVGLGVAFLPDMVSSQDVACDGGEPGRLFRIQVGPQLTRQINLVTWRGYEPSPAVAAFISILREHGSGWRPCSFDTEKAAAP